MNKIMVEGESRMCLFTGSQAVAEKLTLDLRGRVKLEDAGTQPPPHPQGHCPLLTPPASTL